MVSAVLYTYVSSPLFEQNDFPPPLLRSPANKPSSLHNSNFVVHPLPEGSNTGAGLADGQSGALGMGTQAGQGINLTNTFFAYFVPLFG